METGLQLEGMAALKERLRRWRRDPRKYRLGVAVLLFLAGYGLVLTPLGERLALARTRLEAARSTAERVREACSLEAQAALYADRVGDASAFEHYVVGRLRKVGLAVDGLEKKGLVDMGPFQLATLSLQASGTYGQVVEFVDRIERGERLARIDNLEIEPGRKGVLLRCDLLGLVRLDG